MRCGGAFSRGSDTRAAARFEGFFLISPLRGGGQPTAGGWGERALTHCRCPHPGPASPAALQQGEGTARCKNEILTAHAIERHMVLAHSTLRLGHSRRYTASVGSAVDLTNPMSCRVCAADARPERQAVAVGRRYDELANMVEAVPPVRNNKASTGAGRGRYAGMNVYQEREEGRRRSIRGRAGVGWSK